MHDERNNFVLGQQLDRLGRECEQQDGAKDDIVERVWHTC